MKRLFCYYGDDFTGSTDALEALAANGIATVLFLEPPDEVQLSRFPDCQAIGVAGESRSRDPGWMNTHLPAIFQRLRDAGAPICQYKVCSTFDSSPQTGSIGRALEIGREVFQSPYVPIVVAAPHLRRFVAFGNLFAYGGGANHRIDRHPTMSRHPVTPMHEADLRAHLAAQTNARIALLELPSLLDGNAGNALRELLAEHPDAVLFDGINDATVGETGRLLNSIDPRPTFAVGSSGLTHALIRHWRREHNTAPSPAGPVDRLIVVSGSCSPVTESQIRCAEADGFAAIRINLSTTPQAEALAQLQRGKSVVLYTALGPNDRQDGQGGEALGAKLGDLLRELVLQSGVRRAIVAGGDTATHAVRRLGAFALTFAALTTPGAPLCRAHSDTPAIDGLELVLKGGQIGPDHYFEHVRKGQTS